MSVSLMAIVSCSGRDDNGQAALPPVPGPFAEIASPAGVASEVPRLSASNDGLILSWLEPTSTTDEDMFALKWSRYTAGTWSEPGTIVERNDLFVNWADFPSVIEVSENLLAAHWLQYNGPGTYAYQVRLSFSQDGGTSWSPGLVPHESVTQTEHGFVSMMPIDNGVDVFWLDGRAYVDEEAGVMSFRHAAVTSDGAVGTETVLDPLTCDCCQTSTARIPGGSIAAYRGRTTGEIRDIHVVRHLDGAWQAPALVHADGWLIPACPVNGPEIVATGSEVRIAWFTAADDEGRVMAAMSHDAGASFGEPIRIDEGNPLGRIGALALPDGRTIVLWLEAVGDGGGAEVRARTLEADGRMSESVSVGATSAARASGFPVLGLVGDDIVVAWTDPDESRVRIAVGEIVE
jgi:hypothetical protein